MKQLYGAFAVTLVVVAVIFALSNRQVVEFQFWPLPYAMAIPVYAFALGAFALGFLCGGLTVWLRALGTRLCARSATRRLEKEAAALRARLDAAARNTVPGAAPVAVTGVSVDATKITDSRDSRGTVQIRNSEES